jgi:hypothetical protein
VPLIIFVTQLIIVYLNYGKKPDLLNLTIIGLISGFIALVADHFFITIGTIEYSSCGPHLFKIPFYMPFAWNFFTVIFGYIYLRLESQIRKLGSIVVTAVVWVLYGALLETQAYNAKLWIYKKAVITYIGSSSLFMIIGGILVLSSLLFILDLKLSQIRIFKSIKKKGKTNIPVSITKGIIYGIIIIISYVASYYILSMIADFLL